MTRCEVNFILGHVLELSGKSHTRYNWNATAVYCVNITKRHNTCVRSAGWTSQRSTMIRRSTEPFGTRQRLAMTSMIFTIIIQPTKPPSSIRPSTQPREACTEDVYSPRNLHLGFHFAYICIMLYKTFGMQHHGGHQNNEWSLSVFLSNLCSSNVHLGVNWLIYIDKRHL